MILRVMSDSERTPHSEHKVRPWWLRNLALLIFLIAFPVTLSLAAKGGMTILVGGWSIYLGLVTVLKSGDMDGLRDMFPRLGRASDEAWQRGFVILGILCTVGGVLVLITGRGR